jgi:hypothetical protein
MGLFSSSKTSTSNQTFNTDNRLAVNEGFGFSNSNGNVIGITNTTTTTDGGLVSRALDSVDRSTASTQASTRAALSFADGQVSRALETVDSTLNDGFNRLLDISQGLFAYGGDLIDQTQQTVAGAYADAQNTAKGTIDNRTIIVLALAAAGTFAAVMILKKRG